MAITWSWRKSRLICPAWRSCLTWERIARVCNSTFSVTQSSFLTNPTLSVVSTPFFADLLMLPTRPGKAVMSVCVIIQSLSEFPSRSVLLRLHCSAVGNEAVFKAALTASCSLHIQWAEGWKQRYAPFSSRFCSSNKSNKQPLNSTIFIPLEPAIEQPVIPNLAFYPM